MVRHKDNFSELWKRLPWKQFRRNLFRLQCRLWKAVRAGNRKQACNLQKLIVRSQSARLLAIRQVTQLNAGRKTAGIDGKASLSCRERFALETLLKQQVNSWKHAKLREIPIPKKDGSTRILKIPTIADRAWQCLVKYAIEPAHEAVFHARSYGFRPGRSAHDGQRLLFNNLRSSANGNSKRILELDIEKCFDRISHPFLMNQVMAPQAIKHALWRCLKAGVHPEFPEQGTPQGGVVSPLLANIALDGIETIHYCIRYADDMVFILKPEDDSTQLLETINHFLAQRGLNVKPEKTKLVSATDGFDFLGWHFRVQSNGKLRSYPAEENYRAFRQKVKAIVNHSNYGAREKAKKLAPLVRGWRNYHRYCRMRSPKHRLWFLNHRAWKVFSKEKRLNRQQVDQLIHQAFPPVAYAENKHVQVKGAASPFDGNVVYWSLRNSKLYDNHTAKALKRQHHCCGGCGLNLMSDERVHLHHVDGNHGNWRVNNLLALHQSCHQHIHGSNPDCREPDARKRARPDLTGRGGR